MRVVAVIQARMGSSRLPGKVLADLVGAPMLARVVDRAGRATRVTEVWVATTTEPADDAVAAWGQQHGVPVVRGSATDVLGRYRQAADRARADVVVRLTGDCPLLDPELIDLVIAALEPGVDYASNVMTRTHPRGLDVEAFTVAALARMDRFGTTPAEREHVTLAPRGEQSDQFVRRDVTAERNDADLRWTVDTAADLRRIRACYIAMGLDLEIRPYHEVVAWCRQTGDDEWTDRAHLTWDPRRGRMEQR